MYLAAKAQGLYTEPKSREVGWTVPRFRVILEGQLGPRESFLRLEGFFRLEGALSGPVDVNSPVYVQAAGRLYEATPAGEGENPFTCYLPQGTDLEGVRVLYLQDGAVCQADRIDFI